MPRPLTGRQTVYVSANLSREEKATLDAAAKAAGVTRNRFIKDWIATLTRRSPS